MQQEALDLNELDLPQLHNTHCYEGLQDTATCMSVAPGGEQLAVGSFEDGLHLLSAQTLQLTARLDGHAGGTNALCYATDALLVSAGEDGAARVWDCRAGTCKASFECDGVDADRTPDGHTVSNAACSRNGRWAACSAGKTLHVFDLESDDIAESRRTYPPVEGGVIEDVRFVTQNQLLVCYYGGAALMSTEPSGPTMALDYPTQVQSAAATKDLKWLVGGCLDQTLRIWQLEHTHSGTRISELSCGGYSSKVSRVDFSHDGSRLASVAGCQVTIWSFSGRSGPANTIPVVALGHEKAITCQAWQPHGKPGLLVTGGKDGQLLLFDPNDYAEGKPNMSLPIGMATTKGDEVVAVAWATGRLLYSAHASGKVRCWEGPESLSSAGQRAHQAPQQAAQQAKAGNGPRAAGGRQSGKGKARGRRR